MELLDPYSWTEDDNHGVALEGAASSFACADESLVEGAAVTSLAHAKSAGVEEPGDVVDSNAPMDLECHEDSPAVVEQLVVQDNAAVPKTQQLEPIVDSEWPLPFLMTKYSGVMPVHNLPSSEPLQVP